MPEHSSLGRVLRWLTQILARHDTPYQVVGGLAARLYGARRPLVDIDVYVPDSALASLADALAPYVVRPPQHHRDNHWDITFMQLEYSHHTIELGGADSARLYDHEQGRWRAADIDFARSARRAVDGVIISVMPRDELIAYKRWLGRDVDRADLADLGER